MTPLVSIALPVYNCGKYLAQTLDCILAQTFSDFEVIVVLDGCTDESEEILRGKADERFRIIRFDQNEGLVAVANRILREAKAGLVARFDADDLYEMTRLEKQVAYFKAFPETDILGARFDYIDGEGNQISAAKLFPADHKRIKRDFLRYSAIGHPVVTYRREKILAAGGYNQELNAVEDLALWLKCLSLGYRFANLPEVLMHYRQHNTQSSHSNAPRQPEQLKAVYDRYGPSIWGQQYRPWGSKEPRLQKLRRKVADIGMP